MIAIISIVRVAAESVAEQVPGTALVAMDPHLSSRESNARL